MIGLDFLAAHFLGDYILQSHHMAIHKLTDAKVRAMHVTLYTLAFIPFLWMIGFALTPCLWFLAAVWVTHFITDSRRWASGEQWPPRPILVDQAIHAVTLAVLTHLCFGRFA